MRSPRKVAADLLPPPPPPPLLEWASALAGKGAVVLGAHCRQLGIPPASLQSHL